MTFLGHVVGQGQIKRVDSKVCAINDFPRPENKKQLMRFLGMKLAVVASDAAAGAVLLQEGDDGIDHPICYFSRKFNKNQRNYSTVENV